MGMGLGVVPRLKHLKNWAMECLKNLSRPKLLFRGGKENVAVVFSEPHDMPIGDRIVLYGLIRGLKPETYLEIGVRWGGSARIVATAMEANGFGKAIGLDPVGSNFCPKNRELFGRYDLIEGYSPEDTEKAADMLPRPIDLVFIDAVHTYSAVKVDIEGVLPFISDGSHILFHDAYHQGINQAVDEFLATRTDFFDLGIISRNAAVSQPASYAGLRLIRKGNTEFPVELSVAHERAGHDKPVLDRAVWDYDPYANRIGNPLGRTDKL